MLSCSNPQRVFNKYTGEYVFVPCGKCAMCKNKRAARYTKLLEREKEQHKFTFFVTLTYSDTYLPVIRFPDFCDHKCSLRNYEFVSSRERDNICVTVQDLFDFSDYNIKFYKSDVKFFYDWIEYGGLPYCSKSDAQLFLKRLNKYIHDNVTHQYKNFRYFLVSELGSTTFRPHFHAIFYCDSQELADRFSECILSSWKYGITDCQFVQNSACAYVAQYLNKSFDLPYVYQNKLLSPFFLCSRNPFIGAFSQCPEVDAEIVNNASVTTFVKAKPSDLQLSDVPLEFSYQNRLFPKCPRFGTLSDSLRVECYRSSERFSAKSAKDFMNKIYHFINSSVSEFALFLSSILKVDSFKVDLGINECWRLFDETSFNFLRRLYYCSCKVARQACQFGLTISSYIQRIFEYYSKREHYLICKQYELQEKLSVNDCDSLALMYPEYLYNNGFTVVGYCRNIESSYGLAELDDADYYYYSNKRTHFKNAYLDSLRLKESSYYLYCLIKSYLYAKKCNETLEAFAP